MLLVSLGRSWNLWSDFKWGSCLPLCLIQPPIFLISSYILYKYKYTINTQIHKYTNTRPHPASYISSLKTYHTPLQIVFINFVLIQGCFMLTRSLGKPIAHFLTSFKGGGGGTSNTCSKILLQIFYYSKGLFGNIKLTWNTF